MYNAAFENLICSDQEDKVITYGVSGIDVPGIEGDRAFM